MTSKPVAEPECAYLYRLFDRQGALLYVGIAKDVGRRWKQHMREKPWWGQVDRRVVDTYDTWDAAHEAEVAAIITEYPVYNIADVPIERRLAKDLSRLLRKGEVPPDVQMTALLRDLADALSDHLARMPDEDAEAPEPEKPRRAWFLGRYRGPDPEMVPRLAAAWLKERMRYPGGGIARASEVKADAESAGVSDFLLQAARLNLGIKTATWDLCQLHGLRLDRCERCETGLPNAVWILPDADVQDHPLLRPAPAAEDPLDDMVRNDPLLRELDPEQVTHPDDYDEDELSYPLNPVRKRMYELLADRGAQGHQAGMLWTMLENEGLRVARQTVHSWLSQAEKQGYVYRIGKPQSGRSRWIWRLPEGAEFDIPGWG